MLFKYVWPFTFISECLVHCKLVDVLINDQEYEPRNDGKYEWTIWIEAFSGRCSEISTSNVIFITTGLRQNGNFDMFTYSCDLLNLVLSCDCWYNIMKIGIVTGILDAWHRDHNWFILVSRSFILLLDRSWFYFSHKCLRILLFSSWLAFHLVLNLLGFKRAGWNSLIKKKKIMILCGFFLSGNNIYALTLNHFLLPKYEL